MPSDEIIKKHLELLKSAIQDELRNKNLDSSGEASNSLEVEENKLLGNDYIYFLDQGRKPGKFPPPQNIRDWVRDKLTIGDDESSVAYLVGRKIANEGTEIYKDKTKGIQLDNLIKTMLKELYKEIEEEAVKEVLIWV